MTTAPDDFALASRISHVTPLRGLTDKVGPRHTALIVIDVQNDFCAPGGMMDKEGMDLSSVQEMAERLPPLISAARAAGVLVVFVRNVYTSEHNFYLSDAWLEQASRSAHHTEIASISGGSPTALDR